jgi:hypothetical protein
MVEPILKGQDIIIIIIYLICSFTISEANYQLTRGYHGIASSFFTYNYISFIVLNHLFLTMSKYFPIFCICVLFVIFIIFLQATPYSCLTIYRVLIFLSNVLFPYIPVKYVSHLL